MHDQGYDGYRIVISPAGPAGSYPTDYEAENAALHDVTVHSGADGVLASNGAYVGGIDNADSSVGFTVNAPSTGIYAMTVRYANGTGMAGATHTLTVNGQSQGSATYQPTSAWLGTAAQDQVEKLTTVPVTLNGGVNHVVLGKGTGYAELDFVTLWAS